MKIFNWLHCKLQSPSNYSQVSTQTKDLFDDNEELNHENGLDTESEKLLLHDVLNEILTIGTLGHHHSSLSHLYSSKDEYMEIEEVEETEVKEAASVVVTNHEVPVIEPAKLKLFVIEQNNVQVVIQEVQEEETTVKFPLLMEDKERALKRTTLADLFAADAFIDSDESHKKTEAGKFEGKQHQSYCKIEIQHEKAKSEKSSKPMVTAAKTTKKIQKLMMKMVRKKVHPVIAAAKGEMMKERSNTEKLLIAAQFASDVVSAAVFALPSQPQSTSMPMQRKGHK